jgi:formylglycine-generating enzyme required for sulfatase activity
VPSPLGCDAPDVVVLVPETTLVIGPSDWEAEGRVRPRTVHAGPFRIDAFEVTRGRWGGAVAGDAARAASGMTRDEAEAFCESQRHGGGAGRLPTEDEWIVAAVSGASPPPRYPWGETGAVCRRAAWGLGAGPCARAGATDPGPDTVGAHPAGDSLLGIHDLAGNAAEWVAPGAAGSEAQGARVGARVGATVGAKAKGGSWASDLAADLRVWAVLDLAPGGRDPRVGLG